MSGRGIVFIALIVLALGYLLYSRLVSRWLGVDPTRPTPAHTERDDFDYCPARASILLGHHFSSIAGAGPIVGPVLGAVFGWIPAFLWILIGGIFAGAVHDFGSLMASIRHRGRSIGEVIEAQIGRAGKTLFLIFSWCTLILVVAVFDIIVANTFHRIPSAATASMIYIILAIAFGIAIYRLKTSFLPTTVIFVILVFLALWIGFIFPLSLSALAWKIILLGYIFLASILPVWLLLQPRDFLSSFLLYTLIGGATIGIILTNPKMNLPAFSSFHSNLGYLFPVLFVTVACGAISGFHSLIASGTTAKQLNRENDARLIGYGGMLIECLLAVVALISAGFFLPGEYRELLGKGSNGAIELFSRGIGNFLTSLKIPLELGTTYAALAVSAFALTSLDTATRLSRFALQEFFEKPKTSETSSSKPSPHPSTLNPILATLICVGSSAVLIFSGSSTQLWPLFGSANQLLSALALLAVTVWLARLGRNLSFVAIPMTFMFAVTISALITLSYHNFRTGHYLLVVISLILLLLNFALGQQAWKSFNKK